VPKACAAANKIMILQAANTGVTGGSTPDGSDYDREIVIVSTMRMAKIRLINENVSDLPSGRHSLRAGEGAEALLHRFTAAGAVILRKSTASSRPVRRPVLATR